MKLNVSERYRAAVVSIRGEFFGISDGPAFREALAKLRDSGRTNVILDVSQATRLDSSSVGALIEETKALREAGGDLKIAGVNERNRVLQLMNVFGLHDFYRWYPTVEEAVESYGGEGGPSASDASS